MPGNSPVPNYQVKQRLLYGDKMTHSQLNDAAEVCFLAGNLTDAFDLWLKAGNDSGLEKILQQGERDGDLFLVEKALQGLKRQGTPELYNRLGKVASELGKLTFAQQAFAKGGSNSGIEQKLQQSA